MAQSVNWTWVQGEDFPIRLIYKEGDTPETAVVVPLTTGYSVRMDVVVPGTKERVYTFNTEALADVDPFVAGSQPDNTVEGTLSSGAGGTPNISITVPRSLTLPGGALYAKMTGTPAVSTFNFDIFLRNTNTDMQTKILQGQIVVEESNTIWL